MTHTHNEPHSIDRHTAVAVILSGQRKQVLVQGFGFLCDENTDERPAVAPTPMGYLRAGIAACMMTKIHEAAEAFGLPYTYARAEATNRNRTLGDFASGNIVVLTDEVRVLVVLDTPATDEHLIREVLRTATNASHALATVRTYATVEYQVNDRPFTV